MYLNYHENCEKQNFAFNLLQEKRKDAKKFTISLFMFDYNL